MTQDEIKMFFIDYVFELIDNDTIIMDEELTADHLRVKDGDKFVVQVTSDGRVILKKVKDE